MTDTMIVDIDLASIVKADVKNNTDLVIPDNDVRGKIDSASNDSLLRTVTTIGSKKKIISADVVDDSFLESHLIIN